MSQCSFVQIIDKMKKKKSSLVLRNVYGLAIYTILTEFIYKYIVIYGINCFWKINVYSLGLFTLRKWPSCLICQFWNPACFYKSKVITCSIFLAYRKRITVRNFLPSCYCCCCCYWFSSSRGQDCGIINWYFRFSKSVSMLYWGCKLSFSRGIHVRIDNFFIRPTTARCSKQVHLKELNQMSVIKQMLVTISRSCDKLKQYSSTTRVPMVIKLGRMVF